MGIKVALGDALNVEDVERAIAMNNPRCYQYDWWSTEGR